MALGSWYTCIKYVMFAFNFIFWLLGCAVLGVGFWIRFDQQLQSYVDNQSSTLAHIYTFAYIFIGVGTAIMIIGFLGCCGVIRESRCLLAVFFLFLFVIFAALLAVGVYLLIILSSNSMDSVVEKILAEMVEKARKNNPQAKQFMKLIQDYYQCCGTTDSGPLDNCDTKYIRTPCTSRAVEWLKPIIVYISGVAIGISVVLLFGMIFALLLCCAVPSAHDYN